MADHETVGEEPGRPLNPIACSHCRQRKRKCDRQLPHCLQCSHDPSNCHYPEQNKRGIPIGFINRLEARLSETEDALHRLLQYLDQGTFDDSNPIQPSGQSKADRIKEWDDLPLKTMNDIRKWHHHRVGPSPASIASGPGEPLPPTSTPWPTGSYNRITIPVPVPDLPAQNVAQNLDPQTEMSEPSTNLSANTDPMLEASWEVNTGSSEGKAEELGNRRPNLYF